MMVQLRFYKYAIADHDVAGAVSFCVRCGTKCDRRDDGGGCRKEDIRTLLVSNHKSQS